MERTTCDLCRERKVKCNREKPQCQRCRRSGYTCTYPSPKRNNVELNSALRQLHFRLEQAEMKLKEKEQRNNQNAVQASETRSQKQSTSTPPLFNPVYNQMSADEEAEFFNLEVGNFDPSYYCEPPRAEPRNISVPNQIQHVELQSVDSQLSETNDRIAADFGTDAWSWQATNSGETRDSWLCGAVGQGDLEAQTERFHQSYFDIVQRHLPLIDHEVFSKVTVGNDTHQCKALKLAVAMSGAIACGEPSLAMELYSTTRFHIERAESLADNSSFLNLETAQTLLLVARFELNRVSTPKGILTIVQAVHLISLLGYDVLDNPSTEDEQPSFTSSPAKVSPFPRETEVLRRVFWIAFAMHCQAASLFPRCLPTKEERIRTALSITESETDSETSQYVFLSETLTQATTGSSDVFALFILAMRLVVWANHHHQMTQKFVSGIAPEYNFCLAHARLERSITNIFNSQSTPELIDSSKAELRVLTLVITLGVRIELFKSAILGSRKAEFLGPIGGECRKSCLAAANAMSDLLLELDFFDPKQTSPYKEMTMFIMRPLALAADIQLEVLKARAQDIGPNMVFTNREIRQNLQTTCNAMKACKPATGEYDSKIQDCVDFLDRTRLGRPFRDSTTRQPSVGDARMAQWTPL